MAQRRILVSWIGHTDLRAMADFLPASKRSEILQYLKSPNTVEGIGPIKSLLVKEEFDEVHLLSNYDPDWGKLFVKWLNAPASVHRVQIKAPTDYHSIFTAADEVLGELYPRWQKSGAELCFHLSPGTPAMTAIWLLLGKSRYPATFFQTFKGSAWVTEVPFDLAVDFVPQLLRGADTQLQHLAAALPREIEGFQQIIGNSQGIRIAAGRAQRVALRHVPVLIMGETGTGKEMFAQAIHAASPRKNKPFRAINCAAIPKHLLEAELFGYRKGAFTGADREHAGLFEQAHEGTLFLDEVGDCDLDMQAKLLRVLQPPPGGSPCQRSFNRLGESKERTADVRIIAATNLNLKQMVTSHKYREDLYHRLAVITIKLPSLRERRADIPLIAKALLEQINIQFEKQEPGFEHKYISTSAMELVKKHDWPGNVRELYNVLLQAAVMASGKELQRVDIAEAIADMPGASRLDALEQPMGDGFDLESHLDNIERHFLERAMYESKGNKSKASRLLGLKSYQALDAKIKRLELDWRTPKDVE